MFCANKCPDCMPILVTYPSLNTPSVTLSYSNVSGARP